MVLPWWLSDCRRLPKPSAPQEDCLLVMDFSVRLDHDAHLVPVCSFKTGTNNLNSIMDRCYEHKRVHTNNKANIHRSENSLITRSKQIKPNSIKELIWLHKIDEAVGNPTQFSWRQNEQDPQMITTAVETQRNLHTMLYIAAYNSFVFNKEKLDTSQYPH